MCAIDVETTGLDPTMHEIIEIAIIPLNYALKPHPKITPFSLKMRPDKPETVDFKAMSCNKVELNDLMINGTPQGTAADLLERWYEKLGLGNKKIVPLGHNYQFDMSFIKAWIGTAHYEYIFDHNYRDTHQTCLFIADRCTFINEKPTFPKFNLSYVAACLEVKNPAPHTALGDAWTSAECYRKMMGKMPSAMGEIK